MRRQPYNIKLPANEPHQLAQDEAYFLLSEGGQELRLRFHDYAELYRRPGLYEQLYSQRLKCVSPRKVRDILTSVLAANQLPMSELRVLDLGAGNGMFGEQLAAVGVARIIGIDICDEAFLACERDRPGVYDAYYVGDIAHDAHLTREIATWQVDCLSCVAALGFGDIPARAFATAFNLIASTGWVALNIKDSFLLESDTSGFSRLIKALLLSDILEVHHLERYRHRISIDGRPLTYYALIGRKKANVPEPLMPTS